MIHGDICNLLKEMVKAERSLELERQDLALRLDFEAIHLFNILDQDSSGLITSMKFEEWLNHLTIYPVREHLFLFYRRYDQDRDGRISK